MGEMLQAEMRKLTSVSSFPCLRFGVAAQLTIVSGG
jgi:hypothetical protein